MVRAVWIRHCASFVPKAASVFGINGAGPYNIISLNQGWNLGQGSVDKRCS